MRSARHRTYAWLSSSAPLDVDAVAATRTVGGVRAAISGLQSGVEGFVRAHADLLVVHEDPRRLELGLALHLRAQTGPLASG